MNIFTTGQRHQPWVWQVTALCFVLGLLLVGSLRTVSNVVRTGGGISRVGGVALPSPSLSETIRKKDREISDLRDRATKLENTMATGSGKLKTLNDELQRVKVLAGVTEVQGPGVVLTLQDGRPPSNRSYSAERYLIHDVDLQAVVNEFNASGAEAVAINGQRISPRTAIRCVGPVALVNDVRMTSPFEIAAIGDPAKLAGGLNLIGGVLDGFRQTDANMARLETRPRIVVPAYTGSTEVRNAHPLMGGEGLPRDGGGQ